MAIESVTDIVRSASSAFGGGEFNAGSFTIPFYDNGIYPISEWMPPGGLTTLPGVKGMAALTAVGTLTTRTVATTNGLTRLQRLGYVTAATAGAIASVIDATAPRLTLGVSGGLAGGFIFTHRFGISDPATVSGARMFCGVRNTTAAATNVEPSTLINSIGVGHGAADTNLKLFQGGSAAQTPIDLGSNFPITAVSTEGYLLILYAPANPVAAGYSVGWYVKRLGTSFSANGKLTGTVGTAVPAATALLNLSSFRTNNATALAVGLDVGAITTQNLST